MTRGKKDHSFPACMEMEEDVYRTGFSFPACTDECGRGPFAGPVVAAAVIMPRGVRIERLTDSKKISKPEHAHFANAVREVALCHGVGVVSVEEIDRINIRQASRLAMFRAVQSLTMKPDYLFVDGVEHIEVDVPQKAIVKGDYYVHGIAAAAIIAKTYRDELMKRLDLETGSVYGWSQNAGYPTQNHLKACQEHGLTIHHRKSWRQFGHYQVP